MMAKVLMDPAEEAASRKAEAKKHLEAIRKANTVGSTSSLRIGWHGYALKKDNLFGILGFSSEREVWEAAEVCAATWYANLRLAEDFDGLDEETFCGLKQANAKELAKLPTSKRMSKSWLKKAATEPIDAFKLEVEEELDGKATESDGKEKTVSYAVKMPKSRRKAVQEGLLEFAKEVGVEGDESRALELLVAQNTGGTSLVGSITHAIDRIAKAKNLKKSNMSVDEILENVYAELDEIVAEFKQALQNLESPQ